MTMNPKVLGCALGLLLGPAIGTAPLAQALPAVAPPALALADAGNRDRVIAAVQQRYHAKVVRVSETTVNGRPALELRLLSDQRVWNIVVDASTGQVLSGG
jgi:hypothetical protein